MDRRELLSVVEQFRRQQEAELRAQPNRATEGHYRRSTDVSSLNSAAEASRIQGGASETLQQPLPASLRKPPPTANPNDSPLWSRSDAHLYSQQQQQQHQQQTLAVMHNQVIRNLQEQEMQDAVFRATSLPSFLDSQYSLPRQQQPRFLLQQIPTFDDRMIPVSILEPPQPYNNLQRQNKMFIQLPNGLLVERFVPLGDDLAFHTAPITNTSTDSQRRLLLSNMYLPQEQVQTHFHNNQDSNYDLIREEDEQSKKQSAQNKRPADSLEHDSEEASIQRKRGRQAARKSRDGLTEDENKFTTPAAALALGEQRFNDYDSDHQHDNQDYVDLSGGHVRLQPRPQISEIHARPRSLPFTAVKDPPFSNVPQATKSSRDKTATTYTNKPGDSPHSNNKPSDSGVTKNHSTQTGGLDHGSKRKASKHPSKPQKPNSATTTTTAAKMESSLLDSTQEPLMSQTQTTKLSKGNADKPKRRKKKSTATTSKMEQGLALLQARPQHAISQTQQETTQQEQERQVQQQSEEKDVDAATKNRFLGNPTVLETLESARKRADEQSRLWRSAVQLYNWPGVAPGLQPTDLTTKFPVYSRTPTNIWQDVSERDVKASTKTEKGLVVESELGQVSQTQKQQQQEASQQQKSGGKDVDAAAVAASKSRFLRTPSVLETLESGKKRANEESSSWVSAEQLMDRTMEQKKLPHELPSRQSINLRRQESERDVKASMSERGDESLLSMSEPKQSMVENEAGRRVGGDAEKFNSSQRVDKDCSTTTEKTSATYEINAKNQAGDNHRKNPFSQDDVTMKKLPMEEQAIAMKKLSLHNSSKKIRQEASSATTSLSAPSHRPETEGEKNGEIGKPRPADSKGNKQRKVRDPVPLPVIRQHKPTTLESLLVRLLRGDKSISLDMLFSKGNTSVTLTKSQLARIRDQMNSFFGETALDGRNTRTDAKPWPEEEKRPLKNDVPEMRNTEQPDSTVFDQLREMRTALLQLHQRFVVVDDQKGKLETEVASLREEIAKKSKQESGVSSLQDEVAKLQNQVEEGKKREASRELKLKTEHEKAVKLLEAKHEKEKQSLLNKIEEEKVRSVKAAQAKKAEFEAALRAYMKSAVHSLQRIQKS